jgi:hypothetical protein
MTLLEALRDPNLFARFFKGKSWAPWKTFLRALTAAGPQGDEPPAPAARRGPPRPSPRPPSLSEGAAARAASWR